MPAIQKIRKHGALLIGIIGAALFAFIAEEAVRSMETTSNASKQQVGVVFGESLDYPEFQEMVNNEAEIMKMRMGGTNIPDAQMDQIRDQVWNEFVQYQLVKHEADALGLIVTDDEVKAALTEGTAQSLVSTLPMFAQGGRFDYVAFQQVYKQYKEVRGKAQGQDMEQMELILRLWDYAEAKLRRELLFNKYQALFVSTILSNPVNAEVNFNDASNTSTAVLASLPYVALKDKVEVTDDELKAAYDDYKENFYRPFELRDIKYIDVAVTASAADKKALDAEMNEVYTKLGAGEDPAVVITGSKSTVRFVDMPVGADFFPRDISAKLDSMAVGQTTAPYRNDQDNTMNVVKLISKATVADSILFRSIFLTAEDEAKLATRQDSVMKALNAGADFKAVAQKYAQKGDSSWVAAGSLDQSAGDPESAKFVKALYDAQGITSLEINGGRLVLKIEQRKGSATKYVAAVCKCDIAFSKQTYNDAKNKMNLFMSQNNTLEAVEKAAAKAGYQVVDCPNFMAASHNIGASGYNPGVAGTKDAVKWVFDDAKEGQISKMYECGAANDHLLIVGLSAVHERGYLPWDNKDVKEYLTAVVTSKKKQEAAKKAFANVKTIEDAQKNSAVIVDTLRNVTFMQSPRIAATSASEPLIAAAIGGVKVNQCSAPIYGSAGAYIFKVVSHEKPAQKFEAKTGVQSAMRMYLQWSQGFFGSLYKKANVIDNRYKF